MKCLPFLALFWFMSWGTANGQTVYDNRYMVRIQAAIQTDPPRITLEWLNDTTHLEYIVFRKDKDDDQWTDTLAVLDPSVTTWTDTTVELGKAYEYRVSKTQPLFEGNEGPIPGNGYIYAGIQVAPIHHRGSCLVVIDSTYTVSLKAEISRLISDLEADGWWPDTIHVARTDSVHQVKSRIRDWAQADIQDNQAVFLIGRIPVPYSGEIAPDGHADHKGAWPCDGYYAELDSIWTDSIVNVNLPGSRNDNVPGDGKFDNRFFPGRVQLQIGRVDFANMDKFPASEEELLRRYLDKDHAWRMGQMPVVERGLVDNNFSGLTEGLGQVPWRTFSPLFGLDSVDDVPYRSSMLNGSWLWSYGCGGGGPESASDISSTTLMVDDSLQTIFTMLFGSYFGDWDYPNNFLRAAIASGSTLINTWGNRPNWLFHHMALGTHTGHAAQTTMNNSSLYWAGFGRRFVHVGLMGDPTLRMHVLPPVQDLQLARDGQQNHLAWQDPAGAMGYFIYRKTAPDQPFILMNPDPVSDLHWIDSCFVSGWVRYMVRSVELRTSGSGSYDNLSTGISNEFVAEPWDVHPGSTVCTPGLSDGSAFVDPQDGCPPYQILWSTGDTTSTINELGPGTYCVTVRDCLGCTTSTCVVVDLSSSQQPTVGVRSSRLFPNPTEHELFLDMAVDGDQPVHLRMWTSDGRLMDDRIVHGPIIHQRWDVRMYPPGVYRLQIIGKDDQTFLNWTRT